MPKSGRQAESLIGPTGPARLWAYGVWLGLPLRGRNAVGPNGQGLVSACPQRTQRTHSLVLHSVKSQRVGP